MNWLRTPQRKDSTAHFEARPTSVVEISRLLGEVPRRRLLSQQELAAVLLKERNRCDRRGGVFSLLILELPECEVERRIERAVDVLFRRLRMTDEVGRAGEESVGIVLVDTPEFGAWKVAEDLMALLPEDVGFTAASVYCYPSDATRSIDDETIDDEAIDDGHEMVGPPRTARDSVPASEPLTSLFAQRSPGWKRLIDLVFAVIGLVLLSPVFLLTALAIRLTSEGPIFFRQVRAGLGGRPFTMFKFRTMHNGAHREQASLRELSDQDGPAFKLTNDPRITPLGRFLRRTSIDELPQLWNVLRGEMTLVGPRPLPCEESDGCTDWQRRRLEVTPGLTCFWQITGRSEVSFAEWMRLDMKYIQSRSLRCDLSLVLQTIRVVFVGNGK